MSWRMSRWISEFWNHGKELKSTVLGLNQNFSMVSIPAFYKTLFLKHQFQLFVAVGRLLRSKILVNARFPFYSAPNAPASCLPTTLPGIGWMFVFLMPAIAFWTKEPISTKLQWLVGLVQDVHQAYDLKSPQQQFSSSIYGILIPTHTTTFQFVTQTGMCPSLACPCTSKGV